MPPIITLLTDFGTADSYVGEVKGVLLSHVHGAALLDITHQVPPGDLRAGQYILGRVWHRFPQGTVHLAVVDRGAGRQCGADARSRCGGGGEGVRGGRSGTIQQGRGVHRDRLGRSSTAFGIFTFAITRSTKPNSGAKRGSCASARNSFRSRSPTTRHSGHWARCSSRAAGS